MEFKKLFKERNSTTLILLQKKIKKMIIQQESIEESISYLEEELLSIETTCDEIASYLDQLSDRIGTLDI